MEHVDAPSIACGFHASDPSVMRKTVSLAPSAMDWCVSAGASGAFTRNLGRLWPELHAV